MNKGMSLHKTHTHPDYPELRSGTKLQMHNCDALGTIEYFTDRGVGITIDGYDKKYLMRYRLPEWGRAVRKENIPPELRKKHRASRVLGYYDDNGNVLVIPKREITSTPETRVFNAVGNKSKAPMQVPEVVDPEPSKGIIDPADPLGMKDMINTIVAQSLQESDGLQTVLQSVIARFMGELVPTDEVSAEETEMVEIDVALEPEDFPSLFATIPESEQYNPIQRAKDRSDVHQPMFSINPNVFKCKVELVEPGEFFTAHVVTDSPARVYRRIYFGPKKSKLYEKMSYIPVIDVATGQLVKTFSKGSIVAPLNTINLYAAHLPITEVRPKPETTKKKPLGHPEEF